MYLHEQDELPRSTSACFNIIRSILDLPAPSYASLADCASHELALKLLEAVTPPVSPLPPPFFPMYDLLFDLCESLSIIQGVSSKTYVCKRKDLAKYSRDEDECTMMKARVKGCEFRVRANVCKLLNTKEE
jgi:hypothetical protein